MINVEVINSIDRKDKLDEIYKFRFEVYIEELSYLKAGYNDSNSYYSKQEYDIYDEYSRHIILRNNKEIVAYARIIIDKGQGLLILNKIGDQQFLNDSNKVEVSRMMVKKNHRYSRAIIILMNEIYKNLVDIGCKYIFADTFQDSASYQICKEMGFKELGVKYIDETYNLDIDSVVLFSTLNELKINYFLEMNRKEEISNG
ncbi:GNAT family N-acetyltransferase [Vallitalea maricola]|uniref:Uncharacterized protein n=1 Tax=Vallitalea maricola TaxID=3074433 RepID=A0ACB5UI54_9FIRM|nr:hypothetical protein AN2V17_14440 [Vallitalea sp. AN17-2]